MIFVLGLVFLGLIALEAPPLIREQRWRELAAFSGVTVLAMVMGFSAVLDIRLPNPTKGIEVIFKPVGEWLDKLFLP